MHTNGLQIRIFPIEAIVPRNVICFMSGHAYREVTGLIKMINFDYFLLESHFDLAAKQPHCQHCGWALGKWIYNKFTKKLRHRLNKYRTPSNSLYSRFWLINVSIFMVFPVFYSRQCFIRNSLLLQSVRYYILTRCRILLIQSITKQIHLWRFLKQIQKYIVTSPLLIKDEN